MLFRRRRRWGRPPPPRRRLAVAYAFGTLALPYATLFYGHQLTAALLLVRLRPARHRARRRSMGISGRLLSPWASFSGYAIATEYPAALPVAVIGALCAGLGPTAAAPRLDGPGGGRSRCSSSPCYHTARLRRSLTVRTTASTGPRPRRRDLPRASRCPSAARPGRSCSRPSRGLLHHVPWLVLAVLGAVCLVRRTVRRRPEGSTCLGVIVARPLVQQLAHADARRLGGAARDGHAASRAFAAVLRAGHGRLHRGLVAAPARRALVVAAGFVVLVALSASRMLVATAVRPEVAAVDDPFEDYLLPLWRADKVAVNTIPVHTGPSNDDPTAWNLGAEDGAGRTRLAAAAGRLRGRPGGWRGCPARVRTARSDGCRSSPWIRFPVSRHIAGSPCSRNSAQA